MFGVPFYRARQYHAFDVSPRRHQIGGLHGVIDARDLLLDDRPLVQRRSDVMRRRANQLHAARMRLMIGLGALEAR